MEHWQQFHPDEFVYRKLDVQPEDMKYLGWKSHTPIQNKTQVHPTSESSQEKSILRFDLDGTSKYVTEKQNYSASDLANLKKAVRIEWNG